MALPSHSQTTSTEDRVKTYINDNGDTMVVMYYEDARILLRDVLEYEYTDSLLVEYKSRDSLNSSIIEIQKSVLDVQVNKITNLENMNHNLELVIDNKDRELGYKDEIIKQQKKEIRKQKILKIIGFSAAVVLPIVTLIALI